MLDKTPLVTVYIPTCNREYFLKRAIQSVLKQTYPYIEIIVVDDCSDIQYSSDVEDMLKQAYCYQFVKLLERKGAPSARNKAISLAKGDFITGLDDDDIFEPNRIELFLNNWDSKYSFLASGQRSLGSRCGLISAVKNKILGDAVIGLDFFYYENPVGNQIFSSSDRFKNNFFDESLPALQDFELWYRFCVQYGHFLKLKDPTLTIDDKHSSSRITNFDRRISGLEMFCSKYNLNSSMFNVLLLNWKNEFKVNMTFIERVHRKFVRVVMMTKKLLSRPIHKQ